MRRAIKAHQVPRRGTARSAGFAKAGQHPTLSEAWDATVRRHGVKRAVVEASTGSTLTFTELDRRADAWLARHVAEPGRLRGRAVVFGVPNGVAWFEIFLGLMKAGAIAVPLDPGEPTAAQQRIATRLRAAFRWDGTGLQPLPNSRRHRDPATCLIKLTSGSTGQPRALIFSAAQMLADARQVTATMGIRASDLNYAAIPLGHSYGLGNLAVPLIAQGIPLVCGSSPLPHAIAGDFARWRPTVFPGVPSMWRSLTASAAALPGLRLAITAGAPLAPEVARDFDAHFRQRIHSFYGSSETGGISYDRTGQATLRGQVGSALRNVRLTSLRGQRLQVSSDAVVTHGNRRRAGDQGAWIMPDRAAIDSRGHVTLLGRRGRTVKIAGRRVDLIEVTQRLQRVSGVREVWAGVSSGPEPILGAVVTGSVTALEIRAALSADTAAWKIPKKIILVPELPLTPRGKPDTRALQALLG